MEKELTLEPAFARWLEETYKELHRHPELGMNVPWTTQFVRERGADMGLTARELPGLKTGAVFVIEGAQPGPVLALRADMDALPITEAAPVEYRSQNDGVMHACGHDLNTTVMLGVMKLAVERNFAAHMKGSLKFIFQPGEETLEGAKAMIDAGVLHDPEVDMLLMSHGDPDMHVGEMGVFREFSHANSDEFIIELRGKGGHGARPYQTQDLIVAGSRLVEAFQTIVSRDIDGRECAVLSVCSFNAGSASNILPSSARLSGTVRTFRKDVQATVMKRMKEICDGVAAMFHIGVDLEYLVGAPSCPIDERAEDLLRNAGRALLGAKNVKEMKTRTGGEDFAFYAQLKPAGVMRLGITTPGQERKGSTHSPTFQPDLRALPVGLRVVARAAMDLLF